jgi:hypothetical protein
MPRCRGAEASGTRCARARQCWVPLMGGGPGRVSERVGDERSGASERPCRRRCCRHWSLGLVHPPCLEIDYGDHPVRGAELGAPPWSGPSPGSTSGPAHCVIQHRRVQHVAGAARRVLGYGHHGTRRVDDPIPDTAGSQLVSRQGRHDLVECLIGQRKAAATFQAMSVGNARQAKCGPRRARDSTAGSSTCHWTFHRQQADTAGPEAQPPCPRTTSSLNRTAHTDPTM